MIAFHIDEQDDFFLGEDKSLPITIYQADKRTVQSISSWALSWMLKTSINDADVDAVLTKTTSAGITLTTPASGLCTVVIADTDTDSLDPGTYYHELKRTDAGNETVRIVRAVGGGYRSRTPRRAAGRNRRSMAEPLVYYDLEFRFTHGDPLYVTVQEGKGVIQDIHHCTHCGSSAKVKVTVQHEDASVTTMTIHTDKLNGATSTKRIVQPEVDVLGRVMEE